MPLFPSTRLTALPLALVLLASPGGFPLTIAAEANAVDTAAAFEMPSLNYVEVSPTVTILQNERPYGSNITCFALEDGLLFVDTSFFTEIAAKFRKDMEAKYGKKTKALLLSHGHTDHFFGMGAFDDVPVVAAAAARRMFDYQLGIDFKSKAEDYKKIFPKFDDALRSARISMPTLWFEKEIQFGSGEKAVRFRNTGGHSAGSSFAHSPADGVIAPGDNVQVDAHPYFGDPTGNMGTWIETLKDWEAMEKVTICPGHGRPVDKAYLTSTRVFFEEMVAALVKMKAEGLPEADVVRHQSLPGGYWSKDAQEPPWYRPIIAGLYRSIEAQ
jgi:glyoxylase-like metal-dependent hydrolase (beta-lactamase superfamily II)